MPLTPKQVNSNPKRSFDLPNSPITNFPELPNFRSFILLIATRVHGLPGLIRLIRLFSIPRHFSLLKLFHSFISSVLRLFRIVSDYDRLRNSGINRAINNLQVTEDFVVLMIGRDVEEDGDEFESAGTEYFDNGFDI